jgi:hypothetical protein
MFRRRICVVIGNNIGEGFRCCKIDGIAGSDWNVRVIVRS